MLIDLRNRQVYKGLDLIIIVLLNQGRLRESFKFGDYLIEPGKIMQVEMGTKQVMQPFNIMSRFDGNHIGVLIKQVDPFLGIPVISQKVLPDEMIPAIALVQV
jgi:hypothetical protein